MKKKVNVLLIGTLPPEVGSKNFGGVARAVWNTAEKFQSKGVDFCIAGIGRYYKKYQQVNEIEIFGIGLSFISLFKTLLLLVWNIGLLKDLRWTNFLRLVYSIYFLDYISKKIQFDIIHVHHVINQIPLACKILGLETKKIATIHSFTSIIRNRYDQDKILSEIEDTNRQLAQLDYITFVSDHLIDVGKRLDVQWKVPDSVVYNGIDVDLINEIDPPCGRDNSVCFVGTLNSRKGVPDLLESFRNVNDERIILKVIGSGPLEYKVKGKKKIKYLGNVDNRIALREMSKSSLLVVPSKSESFGLVYLEALSVGTPVIGYKPIIRELQEVLDLNEEERSWLIEYDYSSHLEEDLTNKIEQGIEMKKNVRYAEQRKSIKVKINQKLSWSSVADKYISVYSSLRKDF